MNETLMKELGQNGPWAAVSGFLLWTVIKAWTADRGMVTQLLGEFKSSIAQLASAVNKLTERLDLIEAMHVERERR